MVRMAEKYGVQGGQLGDADSFGKIHVVAVAIRIILEDTIPKGRGKGGKK